MAKARGWVAKAQIGWILNKLEQGKHHLLGSIYFRCVLDVVLCYLGLFRAIRNYFVTIRVYFFTIRMYFVAI